MPLAPRGTGQVVAALTTLVATRAATETVFGGDHLHR